MTTKQCSVVKQVHFNHKEQPSNFENDVSLQSVHWCTLQKLSWLSACMSMPHSTHVTYCFFIILCTHTVEDSTQKPQDNHTYKLISASLLLSLLFNNILFFEYCVHTPLKTVHKHLKITILTNLSFLPSCCFFYLTYWPYYFLLK